MLRFLKQMEMNGNVTLQLPVVVDRGGFLFDKAFWKLMNGSKWYIIFMGKVCQKSENC